MSTVIDPSTVAPAGELLQFHASTAAPTVEPGAGQSPSTELVTPPTDAELTWYLGSQRRWVQIITLSSFLLAAISLVRFVATSVWLYPLLLVLAVNIAGVVLSLISGMNKGRDTKASHFRLIREWEADTPTSLYPTVDVFLPSAGEDLAVLRNTYTHVSRMEWAGRLQVWVLDDADKSEVRQLATDFGFNYRVRPNRGYMKKAGNLQAGFGQSDGDFIVIFDADFCPRPDFLRHTIPYMRDPEIAIVQTPQFFDTRGEMTWLERTAGATQELFYRWVQPSRDRAGAAICVGTCAVYRRSALKETGGFAQIEHSEDVHTGMMLMRAGFSVRYVPILVSKGLCPSDLAGFLNQQYRWCNGSITLLRSGQASRRPLSLRQRMAFWSGFMYYISTAVNVFFLHVPGMIMAVLFASDVRASNFIPFLAGAWVYLVLMPRVSKSRWRFEVMRVQMAYSFSHALAITHKLTGRTKGWVATGAVGKKSSLARTIAVIGSLTIGLTLGISWGALAFDVSLLGWHQFWPMAIFLAAYSYVGLPLLRDFLRVIWPKRARSKHTTTNALAPVTPFNVHEGPHALEPISEGAI
ncbi:glycosyltransferase family 2 protein [Galbitalea soli]|uniref:Glycosyltransferase n=1 Tax=Galbitalea soli TaxID=1268042 RepID=A0A7C9TUV9_9MICO|nr:glycosyltransferase family 2 protein [Galbitalea soli]NEM92463.1 glycosyltransferase [Galbitalea soli]NYJ29498.1 cellulose synthase (UDP-forming) [Galbitalea soli]